MTHSFKNRTGPPVGPVQLGTGGVTGSSCSTDRLCCWTGENRPKPAKPGKNRWTGGFRKPAESMLLLPLSFLKKLAWEGFEHATISLRTSFNQQANMMFCDCFSSFIYIYNILVQKQCKNAHCAFHYLFILFFWYTQHYYYFLETGTLFMFASILLEKKQCILQFFFD